MAQNLRIDYNALYHAWRKFRKGKKPSLAIDAFAYNLENNITLLAIELTAGTYKHGGYRNIVLQEKKRRDLAVATVRDRVVHRLLYDYLVKMYDKSFDPDVWSCRAGKGLHACLARTQQLLKRYSNDYIWRADITKFYDNVDHTILQNCLRRRISHDRNALSLVDKVIASYNTITSQSVSRQSVSQSVSQSTGIPIGNLTSQIFANVYLNEFDRFVRHRLKPQAYVRYGDDFILFASTRRLAHEFRCQAEEFLSACLKLCLNPENDVVVAAADGLRFLGHDILGNNIVVDQHTTKSVLSKVSIRNIASYRSLYLRPEARKQLDWILLENIDVRKILMYNSSE